MLHSNIGPKHVVHSTFVKQILQSNKMSMMKPSTLFYLPSVIVIRRQRHHFFLDPLEVLPVFPWLDFPP